MQGNKFSLESYKMDGKEFSPTILYFIKKIEGETHLDQYEKAALDYVENNHIKFDAGTPPDKYFLQKISCLNPRGIIPINKRNLYLAHYESEANQFVSELMGKYKIALGSSSKPNQKVNWHRIGFYALGAAVAASFVISKMMSSSQDNELISNMPSFK